MLIPGSHDPATGGSMQTVFLFPLVLVATSALTVAAVLLIAGALRRPGRVQTTPLDSSDAAFLFEGGALIDSNTAGAALLDSLRNGDGAAATDDWALILRYLAPRFPGIEDQFATPPAARTVRLSSGGDQRLDLTVEWVGGALRLTLSESPSVGGTLTLDRLSYRAMQDELALLRRITETAPVMVWRENPDGQITWANGAYLRRIAERPGKEVMAWPLPPLFPATDDNEPRRVAVAGPGGQPAQSWFDVRHVATGDDRLGYALPADEVQRAERTKQEFIQTLTKTFATLPIGLAVFDRARRLQIFNPALTDLTGLEPEFLLSRPGLEGFLNRMRDKRVLPEPRDWRSWRRRLLEIESSGPSGEFEETWTLPTGQTFRVSANPHPDGALAFLVEDITSETHLTRNVRAEMETSQSVLNQLDTAIAVFAPNGQLVLTNTAFSRLWTLEGEDTLGAVTLPEALENWREAGDDPALWSQIGALSRPGARNADPVTGLMQLTDGERLSVEARRTSTGALMIAFAQFGPQGASGQSTRQSLRASA